MVTDSKVGVADGEHESLNEVATTTTTTSDAHGVKREREGRQPCGLVLRPPWGWCFFSPSLLVAVLLLLLCFPPLLVGGDAVLLPSLGGAAVWAVLFPSLFLCTGGFPSPCLEWYCFPSFSFFCTRQQKKGITYVSLQMCRMITQYIRRKTVMLMMRLGGNSLSNAQQN